MSTQLKFDGPRLDELLERVGREVGTEAVILEANRTRRGGIGGFFAKEWFEVVVAENSDPAPDPLLVRAEQIEDQVTTAQTGGLTFAEALAQADGHTKTGERARSVSAAAPVPAPAPAAAVPPAGPLLRRLRDLPLSEMLAHLDRMVPSTKLPSGPAIIAVVGDLAVSREVAATLAARVGQGPADVLVATPEGRDALPAWLRIENAAAARARSERWRRGEHPVVVAVDLTPGRDGHAWAAEMLAALGADEVRLVARAWQVTDEIGPKAAVLGGIDGLELVELEAAAEPETFLELDLPVVGIDGRPATSELWAALLMERRNDVPA